MPTEPTTGRTMHIGELAERVGLSLRTIRHYDEVDLLRPSGRSRGGFRLYTDGDLDRLLLIRRMKPLGFSLEEMRKVLVIVDGLTTAETPAHERAALRAQLSPFLTAAQGRRENLKRQLQMADEFIALLLDQ